MQAWVFFNHQPNVVYDLDDRTAMSVTVHDGTGRQVHPMFTVNGKRTALDLHELADGAVDQVVRQQRVVALAGLIRVHVPTPGTTSS